jgi:hypothetical protein
MRLRNGGKDEALPSLFPPNTLIYLYASTVHKYCIFILRHSKTKPPSLSDNIQLMTLNEVNSTVYQPQRSDYQRDQGDNQISRVDKSWY